MVQATKQREKEFLLEKIAALHAYFNNHSDVERKRKAEQLAVKLHDEAYTVAFCGHFSAGKSTMINELVGENLLPSSPIPTSANLVTVKTGEDYAKVFYHHDQPHVFPAPYHYEDIKSYCKDGDEIKAIEISYSRSLLPKGAVIMDTPGIDSTDDAHRIATESALHLADLVFYVMDYNHVQSEVNFSFVKELVTAGKELYLIINQIDKHREEELSFTSFTHSVKNAFAAWGIERANIFYTSLRETEHRYNQFSELQQFITNKMNNRKELLFTSLFTSLKKLVAEHISYLEAENQPKIANEETLLATLSPLDRSQLTERFREYDEELSQLESNTVKTVEQFDEGINDILKNAYLMPYETRKRAEQFLQACQLDFKVGILFTKQKTAAERMERLIAFYEHLKKNVTSQIDWHVRELVIETAKQHQLENSEVMQEAQAISVCFEQSLLENLVKDGARLSGDYVLNYTNEIAQQLKLLAKKTVIPIRNQLIQQLDEKTKNRQQALEKEIAQLSQYIQAESRLREITAKQRQAANEVTEIIERNDMIVEDLQKGITLVNELKREEVVIQSSTQTNNNVAQLRIEPQTQVKNRQQVEGTAANGENDEDVSQIVEHLRLTAHDVEKLPGFAQIAEDLLARAERLAQRDFTVALFGAFSAGKSSFANALVGEKLLPVSPNPTTATINKIMPTDDEHHHHTARVKLKEQDHLLEDVNRSLFVFELQATTLDESLKIIGKLLQANQSFDPNVEMQRAFLQAFYDGFSSYREQLGHVLTVNLEQFKTFVADEEKSCLVEWIEVYVDCELTRKGITIVDTPGADSINARHTSVAFDYIKNSDACFFVTYYNHAFSKADREFLIQLGRVKDSFELDKMFFIINAIDLASSEAELETVLHYVQEQLITYGIRQPNMYPVSSLLGLKEKLTRSNVDHSRLNEFEHAFYAFLQNEIMHVAVKTAEFELQRVDERLKRLIQLSTEDQALKFNKQKQLKKEKAQAEQFLTEQHESLLRNQLIQEADELTFYIKQRVFLRFGDFFKESINPSVIKSDGRDVKKALTIAFEDFLYAIGFDFSQEMRATTLRLEKFLQKQFAAYGQTITKQLVQLNDAYSFTLYELSRAENIDFVRAFADLGHQDFKQAFVYFKNPKTFFEKNDRQLMSDTVEQQLLGLADQYLQTENDRMKGFYVTFLNNQFANMIQHYMEQMNEFYDSLFAVYDDDSLVDRLVEVDNKISKRKKERNK